MAHGTKTEKIKLYSDLSLSIWLFLNVFMKFSLLTEVVRGTSTHGNSGGELPIYGINSRSKYCVATLFFFLFFSLISSSMLIFCLFVGAKRLLEVKQV